MSQDLIVVENAISPENQDLLEQTMLGHSFAWYCQRNANYLEDAPPWIFEGNNGVETPQMTHLFYEKDTVRSDYFPLLLPLLTAMPFQLERLDKIKANLTVRNSKVQGEAYGAPHVDTLLPGLKTGVYYVNDSTGDTYIFNEQCTGALNPMVFKDLTVKQRITPKKGTLVVFDGSLLHAGNCPRDDDPRVVINFNFISKPTLDNF